MPLDAWAASPSADGADFQRVHLGEIGDLVERQRGIVDKPHGSRFLASAVHCSWQISFAFAHPLEAKRLVISDDGNYAL